MDYHTLHRPLPSARRQNRRKGFLRVSRDIYSIFGLKELEEGCVICKAPCSLYTTAGYADLYSACLFALREGCIHCLSRLRARREGVRRGEVRREGVRRGGVRRGGVRREGGRRGRVRKEGVRRGGVRRGGVRRKEVRKGGVRGRKIIKKPVKKAV
jgi:hypothetical protein